MWGEENVTYGESMDISHNVISTPWADEDRVLTVPSRRRMHGYRARSVADWCVLHRNMLATKFGRGDGDGASYACLRINHRTLSDSWLQIRSPSFSDAESSIDQPVD